VERSPSAPTTRSKRSVTAAPFWSRVTSTPVSSCAMWIGVVEYRISTSGGRFSKAARSTSVRSSMYGRMPGGNTSPGLRLPARSSIQPTQSGG